MLLHHEFAQAATPAILQLIAWGLLGLNAAGYYVHLFVRWTRTRTVHRTGGR